MVIKKDNEGIIMALNQTHYGMLKSPRDAKELKAEMREGKNIVIDAKVSGDTVHNNKGKYQKKVDGDSVKEKCNPDDGNFVLDFINHHAHFVDEWIIKNVNQCKDYYISKALYQIHTRILGYNKESKKSFKDVLLEKSSFSAKNLLSILKWQQAPLIKCLLIQSLFQIFHKRLQLLTFGRISKDWETLRISFCLGKKIGMVGG